MSDAGIAGSSGKIGPFAAGDLAHWLQVVGLDLRQHAVRSIVIAGDETSTELQALALAMNERLGNIGQTVLLSEPVEVEPQSNVGSLRDLVQDMRASRVEILIILGGNPVYDAPADLAFVAAMDKVPLRAHLSLYEDETSELCHWHIPQTHELEAWGDARAYDGTASVQPHAFSAVAAQ